MSFLGSKYIGSIAIINCNLPEYLVSVYSRICNFGSFIKPIITGNLHAHDFCQKVPINLQCQFDDLQWSFFFGVPNYLDFWPNSQFGSIAFGKKLDLWSCHIFLNLQAEVASCTVLFQ